MSLRIAIVGGGIAGLTAAEAIARKIPGARATVLEAEKEPGGKILTRREDGFVVETGPHGFLDKEPAAMALVDRLGLREDLVRADEASAARYIVRDGKLRKLPAKPPAFLTSDILPLPAKLRILMEPWVAARANGEEEESVWDFAARRLGPMAADVMVDAFVTGIYGGDPKRLSLSAAFPRLAELERQYGSLIRAQMKIARGGTGGPGGTLHSFKDGLGTLISALASRVDVQRGFRAHRIERRGKTFRVEGEGGPPVEADAVVVTVPAYETARLLRPYAEEECKKLEEIRYAPVAVVVQGFHAQDLGHDLRGFGFLVPDRERRQILGSIWASTVFAGHAPDGSVMLRTLLGGSRHPEHAEGDDATLGARARDELVGLMGIRETAQPTLQKVIRWPQAIPQYEIGHADRVAAAAKIQTKVPGIVLGGNALRGVAMIQCVADAERVAEAVERHGGPRVASAT